MSVLTAAALISHRLASVHMICPAFLLEMGAVLVRYEHGLSFSPVHEIMSG